MQGLHGFPRRLERKLAYLAAESLAGRAQCGPRRGRMPFELRNGGDVALRQQRIELVEYGPQGICRERRRVCRSGLLPDCRMRGFWPTTSSRL